MKTEKIGRAIIHNMRHYKTIQVNGKQVRLHRHLVEQKLGRSLNSDEVVHHKNGDKHDNRIENLEVMSRSEHIKHHPEVLQNGKKNKIKINFDEILLRKKAGMTAGEIAEYFDVSASTIINRMKDHGVCRTKLSKHQVNEIRNLINDGVYQKEIAKKYGVSRQLISKIKTGKVKYES